MFHWLQDIARDDMVLLPILMLRTARGFWLVPVVRHELVFGNSCAASATTPSGNDVSVGMVAISKKAPRLTWSFYGL